MEAALVEFHLSVPSRTICVLLLCVSCRGAVFCRLFSLCLSLCCLSLCLSVLSLSLLSLSLSLSAVSLSAVSLCCLSQCCLTVLPLSVVSLSEMTLPVCPDPCLTQIVFFYRHHFFILFPSVNIRQLLFTLALT